MLECNPKPLVFLVFCLQPEGVHLLEGGVFGFPPPSLKAAAEGSEAPGEFGPDSAKRVVRVELQVAGEGTQQQIAEFLRSLGGLT